MFTPDMDTPNNDMPESGLPESDATVFVIDDDESVRTALHSLLTLTGQRVEAFGSIEEFVSVSRDNSPSCLVLDVRLPGMSGLEFQEKLANGGIRIPIIFITAQGDSAMTRRALKAGAVDFLTKPFRKHELLTAIQQALALDRARREEQAELSVLESRFESLTPREGEVFELVVAGLMNKQIADKLCLSEASIKFHRGHVMQKMQAPSVADLVRMSERLNLGHRT
jgi:FixJ family two-component response regulator